MKPPRGFTAAVQRIYLDHLRQGMQRGAAAQALNCDRTDVRAFIDGDAAFRIKVESAERDALEHVMEGLFQGAVTGNVSAAKTWLEMQGMAPNRESQLPGVTPPPTSGDDDPFGDLDNVEILDKRRRRGA